MSTKRKSYCAAFKLQVVNYANQKSNRAAGRTFGVSEKLVRDWRKAEVSLTAMDKSKKANRGNKARWPQLEKRLSAWLMEQLAAGIFLSTAQLRLQAAEVARAMDIKEFAGGASWCYRFMHRNHLCLEKVTLLRCPEAASGLQTEDPNFRIKQDEALLFIKNEKEELECSTEADQLPPLLEAPQTEENDNAAVLHEAKEYEDLPSEPESLFAPLSEADIKTSESSETYDSEDDKKLTKRDATKAAVEVRQDGVQVSGETGTRSDEQVQSGDGKIPTETFENGDEGAKPRRDFDDFNCPQCDKTFYSKKGLKNHMPTHAPEVKLAPCSARKYSLKDFIKQEDDDDGEFGVPSNLCDDGKAKKKPQNAKGTEFQCSICQQVLENKAALKGHLREHKNELNFACDSCDQKFKRKEHLTRHLRVHVPRKESWRKRKFQDTICPQCGKMFDNGSKMLHHMAKCKRLACKVCGKRFSRRHNLLNHAAQNHKEENSTENQVSADGPPPSKTCERGQNGEDRRSGSDAGERSDVDGGKRRQGILKTKMIGPPEMNDTKRQAYEAQFKIRTIDYAVEHGNRAAAREFDVNESMVRKWRKQEKELRLAKKKKLSFRGNKARWPALEVQLERWIHDLRAVGRNVSTLSIRMRAKALAEELKIEHFQGGPSWCFRFMKRHRLSIRVRPTVAQQLPADYIEKPEEMQVKVEEDSKNIFF
ncbi:uncharacterized protein LOC144079165 isoform X1 [Stigmatopora argus]